jgi:hypothetical protein
MQVKRIRAQQAAHSQGTRHENSVGRQTAQEERWKEKNRGGGLSRDRQD